MDEKHAMCQPMHPDAEYNVIGPAGTQRSVPAKAERSADAGEDVDSSDSDEEELREDEHGVLFDNEKMENSKGLMEHYVPEGIVEEEDKPEEKPEPK